MDQARHKACRVGRSASALSLLFGAIRHAGANVPGWSCRSVTASTSVYFATISSEIGPGARAALMLDQAGWDMSGKLGLPPNTIILPLPLSRPNAPPILKHFMCDEWRSNLRPCSPAWNRRVDRWWITSTGLGPCPVDGHQRAQLSASSQGSTGEEVALVRQTCSAGLSRTAAGFAAAASAMTSRPVRTCSAQASARFRASRIVGFRIVAP